VRNIPWVVPTISTPIKTIPGKSDADIDLGNRADQASHEILHLNERRVDPFAVALLADLNLE
jgi:hypothetical protein